MDSVVGDRGGNGRGELGGKGMDEGGEDSGVRKEGEGFNVLFDDGCGNRIYQSNFCKSSFSLGKIMKRRHEPSAHLNHTSNICSTTGPVFCAFKTLSSIEVIARMVSRRR